VNREDLPAPSAEVEQPAKDYYYDDATGYEIYRPDNEDDDETDEAELE
jgi:hypothetical protein